MKFKRCTGFIITLSLIVLSVTYLGILVRPVDTDIAVSAIEAFHELPENSVEVIGYGSSHMWRSLDTIEMYEKYGIGAYNYGCNWQHINTTSLFLKDSLRTQSPKVILIETFYVNNFLLNSDINGEIYYTRAIDNFPGKREYLKQCFGNSLEGYLSYYMPLCAFHDNWVNISKDSFVKSSSKNSFLESMGFLASGTVVPVTIGDPASFEQQELNKYAKSSLDEIVKECKQRNIEIIFFTVPWQGEYKYSDAMKKYSQENDCLYYNMFELIDEVGLDGETDFSDVGHLNTNGAKKVANYLGKIIVENFEVTDMRTVGGNLWEK